MNTHQSIVLVGLLLALTGTSAVTQTGKATRQLLPLKNTEVTILRDLDGAATIFIGGEPFASAENLILRGRFAKELNVTGDLAILKRIDARIPPEPTPTPSPEPKPSGCMAIACLGFDVDQKQLIRVIDMNRQ